MPTTERKRFWVRVRRLFRWCRIGVLFLLLALLCGFIYVNQIGVPEFIKAPILAELRDRGLGLEFRRMRVRWYHGIVAEGVEISRYDHTHGPQLEVREAEIRLNPEALRRFHLKVDSVLLRDGQVVWPLLATNKPVRRFKLENAATELRFLEGDQWELDHFNAVCQGVKLKLNGVITNASAFRQASAPYTNNAATRKAMAVFEDRLREFVNTMERLKFPEPPEIILTVHGDARLGSYDADLECDAPNPRTPWGSADHLHLTGTFLQPPGTNGDFRSELVLNLAQPKTEWAQSSSAEIRTKWNVAPTNRPGATVEWEGIASDLKSSWGGMKHLNIAGESTRSAGGDELLTHFNSAMEELESKWVAGTTVGLTASVTASMPNWSVSGATGDAAIADLRTPWGTAKQARLKSKLSRRDPNNVNPAKEMQDAWAAIEPFELELESEFEGFKSRDVALDKVHLASTWLSPVIQIGNCSAQLYGGNLDFAGSVNIRSRRAEAAGNFDVDPGKIAPLLDEGIRPWITDHTWNTPPKVRFQASATLPSWTNAQPDWAGELGPSLVLASEINAGAGAYRGVAYDSAELVVAISNRVIELPRVIIRRPEGAAEISFASDLATRSFHVQIASGLDPKLAMPLLEDAEQRDALNLIQFTTPPKIHGEIWGRAGMPELLGAEVRLAITNFVFRGEPFSNIVTSATYTNKLIRLTDISVQHDAEQKITAPLATLDLTTQRLWFTNGVSTLDPLLVRVIDPQTVEAIRPYHFHKPPRINLHGSMPLNEILTTDLHFEIVEGGHFDWLNFNLPQVVGNVLWITNRLIITNVDASFYSGRIKGDAVFAWGAHGDDADYHFHLDVADANLNHLLSDLSSPTNKLEGTINGSLTITSANTGDIHSWNGYGTAFLKDGLLWNFPLYGLFSPVLNALAPGLGNSRAKEGTATYIITNSVIRTDDLEIRSPPVRLHYDGTVDFEKVVKAKVVADPMVGPFILLVKPFAKIFEYKVTGTLENPKSEPLFIPKLFMFPLHPFQSIKGLFQPSEEPPKPAPSAPEKKP